MQTTLLGLAIAIILALVTALVGPLFIDWGRYRSTFETEGSRLVGQRVRIFGPIDARLLPTPSLILRDIEINGSAGGSKLRIASFRIEFALGSLVRGEWQAAELRIGGSEIALGLDSGGKIDALPLSIGFDPDQLSVERLIVENARLTLSDSASGARLQLDKLSFNGDLRSLNGPFKGEGSFASAGQVYAYRLTGGRRSDDGGIKLRLSVDPSDLPFAAETEGTLWIDQRSPRYEGTFALARPAGLALSSGKTLVNEPWRAEGRIRATPTAALLEQLEFQYAPEERALKLSGTARIVFGPRPRFESVLSARQIDLDRAFPDAARRTPGAAVRALSKYFASAMRPAIPVKIGLGIDSLIVGGAPLQSVRGDVQIDGDNWSLDSFEFRAPGLTQIRLSGRMKVTPDFTEFTGPVSVDASDLNALVAWIEARPDATKIAVGPLRARGEVTIGGARIAVERLRAEFDHKSFEGRLAYAFGTGGRTARLDAALTAAEFDVDGAIAFANYALSGTSFDRPGEIAAAIQVGKATYAGVEAKNVKANLKFDAAGLQIETLSVGDFGGAFVNASGRIDTSASSPRGTIAFSLDAQRWDGIAALVAKFVPKSKGTIQNLARRLSPTKVSARLDMEPLATDTPRATTSAKLRLDGTIAGIRVNLLAEGSGDRNELADADVRVNARFEADDGASLSALLGLDRIAAVKNRPATFNLTASGPVSKALRINARFDGAGLELSAGGAVQFPEGEPHATLNVVLSAADARLPRREASAAVPVSVRTRLALAGDKLTLDDVVGNISGAMLSGRLGFVLGSSILVDGHVDVDSIDAAAVTAIAIGMPPATGNAQRSGQWSTEPFVRGPFFNMNGQIKFSVGRAALPPVLVAQHLTGTVQFEPSAITVDQIQGRMNDGQLFARVEFRNVTAGLSTQTRVALTNADLAALMPRSAQSQVAGRIGIQVECQGIGLSPAALIGSLQGSGTITVEQLEAAGLDPAAIDAVVRAVDRGLPPDTARVGNFARSALDVGRLSVPLASGAVTISSGHVGLKKLMAPAKNADISVGGDIDLSQGALDLRFGLIGPAKTEASSGSRPEIQVAIKGPIDAPRRTVDVTSLVGWLALQSVEREAKRLEAAEQEAKRLEAIESARRAPAQEKIQPVPVPTETAPELPPPITIDRAPGAFNRKPPRTTSPRAPPSAAGVPTSAVPTFNAR